MTDQPDNTPPELLRLDGEEFFQALASLIQTVAELSAAVAGLAARVERLEQRGRGFKP
jgi:hypothetical protein